MQGQETIHKVWPLLALCLTLIVQGCGSLQLEDRDAEAYETYMERPESKALAVRIASDGAYVYGFGSNHSLLRDAVEQAFFQCETRREIRQIDGSCELYMLNGTKVSAIEDMSIEAYVAEADREKEQSRPSFEDRASESLEEYQTQATEKALAVCVENGRFAWGYGYGYASREEATQRALSECEERREDRGIEGTCTLYMINDERVGDVAAH